MVNNMRISSTERLTEKITNKSTGEILAYRLKRGADILKSSKKLGEYEDLEEQGLLQVLPFGIGSDVYFIPSVVNYNLNKLNGHEENNRVYHQKIARIVLTKRGWYAECDVDSEYGTNYIILDKFYKETWFITEKEAEEALLKRSEEKQA